MKITYLGTCSGTEPMKGMHHTSLLIEVSGSYYWFDAGECAAHTAYTTLGTEVLNTRALFISHPHIDHTGGLANILALFWKLTGMHKQKLQVDNTLKVFFPGLAVFRAVKLVLTGSPDHKLPFKINENEVTDGLLYEDEKVKVYAMHNKHLGEDGTKGWHSYSYLIEAEGKRVVFSGDVASSEELVPLVEGGCDLLIHETGHHQVGSVCEFAERMKVGALRFTHHGRAIINGRAEMQELVKAHSDGSGISMKICSDGDTDEI